MFLPLLTGLGVSASAGLNAYIPLLVLALADRIQDGELLAGGYEFIASIPAIATLLVLVTIELVADKSPIYRANDILQSIVRPAAGALAFMASVSTTDFNTVAALLIGLVAGGVVHATKAAFRLRFAPRIRAVFVPGFSFAEDLYAGIQAIVAIVAPIVVPVLLLPVVGIAIWTAGRKAQHDPAPEAARASSSTAAQP